jgi:hypothetical protein
VPAPSCPAGDPSIRSRIPSPAPRLFFEAVRNEGRLEQIVELIAADHIGHFPCAGPLLPVLASQTPAGGHPEATCRRTVVNAIRYVIHNGCVWRALPADSPWRTVYGIYQRWHAAVGVTSERSAK